MLKLEETGATIISKQDFCEKTKISESNWMFTEVGQQPRFWMYESHDMHEPDRYYFDNDIDSIREFKYMKIYRETWMRQFKYSKTEEGKKGEWSLWNTWKIW